MTFLVISALDLFAGVGLFSLPLARIFGQVTAVEEAGVCGQADSQWGQVPIAFVVLKSGRTVTTEELLSYTAQKLARYKQPRAIYFTDQLPHTSSGKLLRRELPRLLQILHK